MEERYGVSSLDSINTPIFDIQFLFVIPGKNDTFSNDTYLKMIPPRTKPRTIPDFIPTMYLRLEGQKPRFLVCTYLYVGMPNGLGSPSVSLLDATSCLSPDYWCAFVVCSWRGKEARGRFVE